MWQGNVPWWEEGTCLSFLNAHIVRAFLFMYAGNVIHSIDDSLVICFMGGLYVYMHYTSSCLIVYNFALCGMLYLAGFYSRDYHSCMFVNLIVDRSSSVSIATHYNLDGLGIESPWGARSAPIQTSPGAHPSSFTMGIRYLFQDKAAGAWHWLPTPSSTDVKERVDL